MKKQIKGLETRAVEACMDIYVSMSQSEAVSRGVEDAWLSGRGLHREKHFPRHASPGLPLGARLAIVATLAAWVLLLGSILAGCSTTMAPAAPSRTHAGELLFGAGPGDNPDPGRPVFWGMAEERQ